jgi:hypothetical protein
MRLGGPAASNANDAIRKSELEAAITATGGTVVIFWTGSAWPSRASSIPSGYTGTVTFDSTSDAAATAPADALSTDRWLKISSGGAVATTVIEVDFGTKPIRSKTFTITDAAVLSTSNISALESGKPATGRIGIDAEWDSIVLAVLPAAGSFKLIARAIPGPVKGKRKIQYQVS